MLKFLMQRILFRGCLSKKPNFRNGAFAVPGFSFIEIMGALLVFSLLGTTLIVSQGAMMRAVGRIVHGIEALFEGSLALGSAQRSGALYLKEDATSKTIQEAGKISEIPLEIFVRAFEKEGPYKDFVPGAFGRIIQKSMRGDQELFVFFVGPNYIEPQDRASESGQKSAIAGSNENAQARRAPQMRAR